MFTMLTRNIVNGVKPGSWGSYDYLHKCTWRMTGWMKLSSRSTIEVPLRFGSLNPRDDSDRSKMRNLGNECSISRKEKERHKNKRRESYGIMNEQGARERAHKGD
jgi:hypothetical protein